MKILTEQETEKMKAFHVVSGITVQIYNTNGEIFQKYHKAKTVQMQYKLPHKYEQHGQIRFCYGLFKEVFILLDYKDTIISAGPILTKKVSTEELNAAVKKYSRLKKTAVERIFFERYCESIPLFSLGDLREIIILLGTLLNLNPEQIRSEKLHKIVFENELEFQNLILKDRIQNGLKNEKYAFYYECKILNLVAQGDSEKLRQGIANLGNSVIPAPTSSSVRTEKNYTIVIAEKLAALAIQAGKDIAETLKLRDFYIAKTEAQDTLAGVLTVRDSAIIHFTKQLHGLTKQGYSPLIYAAMQYINLHIYDSFRIREIADHFYISESALRRRFKKETGYSITEYISRQKINEAKIMLKAGLPTSEISARLNFFDLSHFHRMFRKYENISPKQFQETEPRYRFTEEEEKHNE